jgi:AIG2-like family
MGWGYVYRVSDGDQQELKKREGGYEQILAVTVYLLPPNPGDDPSPLTAFTFVASSDCPQRCGPKAGYLDVIIAGAEERKLPTEYRQTLVELREALSNKQVSLHAGE